jgi:hypothetical protein
MPSIVLEAVDVNGEGTTNLDYLGLTVKNEKVL